MANWFTETFSSDASEDDVIKSRALNSTRIAAVVFPLFAGIAAAIGDLADKPPFDDTDFQKVLIIAAIAFIGFVTVGDMFARAISATKAPPPVATAMPGLPATWQRNGPDLDGTVVAFRALNADTPTGTSEFLFVPEDGDPGPTWVKADALDFPKPK